VAAMTDRFLTGWCILESSIFSATPSMSLFNTFSASGLQFRQMLVGQFVAGHFSCQTVQKLPRIVFVADAGVGRTTSLTLMKTLAGRQRIRPGFGISVTDSMMPGTIVKPDTNRANTGAASTEPR
jgi:hypothetical protein